MLQRPQQLVRATLSAMDYLADRAETELLNRELPNRQKAGLIVQMPALIQALNSEVIINSTNSLNRTQSQSSLAQWS